MSIPPGGFGPTNLLLRRLLNKVERERGLDFHHFRPAYVERRLATRMRATGCPDYLAYDLYLNRHPEEYRHLVAGLTINVTDFFRDKDVYRALEERVIPAVVADHQQRGHRIVRIWSAGCASGEEPFSVAMLVAHAIERIGADVQCSVYGTDIDDASLQRCREARYPLTHLPSIPETYRKYVMRNGESFTLAGLITEMAKFKKMDLFADTGIRRVDVILCRNVLIYFDKEQQQQLVHRFYQSLVAGGYLIIGKCEKLQYDRDAFAAVDTDCRIYRKMG